MLVVCDTGPLVHLHEAELTHLLRPVGRVTIPTGVAAETSRLVPSLQLDWIETHPLAPDTAAEATGWEHAGILDCGEAQAIALARQLGSDWLLTDDAAARLIAQGLGLEVHGSLGVVLWAAAVGHLDRAGATTALDALARSSLWISARVLTEARAALDRLCAATE